MHPSLRKFKTLIFGLSIHLKLFRGRFRNVFHSNVRNSSSRYAHKLNFCMKCTEGVLINENRKYSYIYLAENVVCFGWMMGNRLCFRKLYWDVKNMRQKHSRLIKWRHHLSISLKFPIILFQC